MNKTDVEYESVLRRLELLQKLGSPRVNEFYLRRSYIIDGYQDRNFYSDLEKAINEMCSYVS